MVNDMNNSVVNVTYYDGKISKPYKAQISPDGEQSIIVRYGDHLELVQHYTYQDMTLIGALGHIQPVIELKGDARLDFHEPLPNWFNLHEKGRWHSIWKLERSPSLILFSVIFVVGFAFALVKWGIPAAAHVVANQLPATALNSWGDQAEKYIFEMTEPSELPKARQEVLLKKYQQLVAEDHPAKVLFRGGGHIGANALAIPNNTIIVTDELVEMAKDDYELIGVLAHEQGHLVQRHSLQQSLSGLGISIILLMITGDGSDILTSLPVAAVGASYSRDFESEADLYALKMMSKQNIPTIHFANFLQRMEDEEQKEIQVEVGKEKGETKSDPDKKSWTDFFQSHPATKARIEAVRNYQSHQH